MLTYNQIIKISRAFQQAHHVLKNFGNGGEWDRVVHNQQATYKYPLMWMDDLPSSLSEGAETYNFRVAFLAPVVTMPLDRGSDLMSTNVNEVKSDMIQCANDFIAYWVNQTDDYEGLVLEKSVNRTTFEDVTDDKLTGCYIDITFRQSFDYNECSIPMGTPTSIVTCAPVYIYEDGVLVDTVASGGSYSYSSSSGVASQTFNGGAVTDQDSGTTKAITVKDSGGNNVGTKGTDTALALDITIADATQTMNAVAITSQLPETAKTFVIRYANNDPVIVTTITDTATSFIGEVPDVVIPKNVATPYKDGQTTSFVTGDAGANEDGYGTDFFTLPFNNDFGNLNRFTSENGDQSYTTYIVDHAHKNQENNTIRVWHLSLTSDSALNHLANQPYTIGGLSGWKIPRTLDVVQIFNYEQPTSALNYAPFNINANSIANSIILQNTLNTTTGYRFANQIILNTATLSNTMRRIEYRDCTLTEINSL